MALPPADPNQAFLREVDENLRADQLADFGRRYGRWILGAIVVGLIALAGYLYWQHHRTTLAGEQGEKLQAAFESLGAGAPKAAEKPLAELATSDIDGYRAAALMSQAVVAMEQNDTKTAAARLGAVAGDTSLPQPYRDLALVKQTMVEFDTLQPQAVIDRLKPLAVKESAFFGTAGEMVALSYLRLNQRAQAGQLFGAIGRTDTVPQTIRQRAVQMAGVLGVDAVQTRGTDKSGTAR